MANLANLLYVEFMRSVNIGELKNQLSAYLQYVRNGEEVVVRDRKKAIARILPIDHDTIADDDAELVASGAMTLPQEQIDWDAFFSIPTETVPGDAAVQALIEGRGDR